MAGGGQMALLVCMKIYYVKVSGIPSGNKLIKLRYDILTCEDIDDFTDIKFAS